MRTGALVGFVFGLAFFLPLLPWIGEFVGAVPWVALSVVMAAYLALFGAMATVTMRARASRRAGETAAGGVSAAAPLWFALCWVAVEWLRSSFPFGGFPWGAAAFSQNQGFFLPVARWLGVPGLSFTVALVGAGIAALVIALVQRPATAVALGSAAACAVVPAALAGIAMGTAPAPEGGDTIRVAAIQGNVPRLGLDFNQQRRAVLDNHFRETLRLAEDVDSGKRARPDLILWPENASDISPLDNADAARVIRSAVSATGIPIVFGTLLYGPDGRPTNTVLVWETQNSLAAPEPADRYDKHIIQPFGEYLPWRGFFSKFSSYADRAGDFRAGTGPAVVDVNTPAGAVVLGVSTCWEVAFDRSPRQAVGDGAQLLFVPTNNATFGHTDMTYQQLAMSQVRAVETGRAVAVAATSGVSALIDPAGRVLTNSEIFSPAILEAELPLRTGTTPAVTLGPWPQLFAVLCAVGGFLYALRRHTRFDTFTFSRRGTAADEGTP
ncbi:hypothetical protein GCM10022231_29730 [Gordonia caeni]|uniref:Apolipoprotein N-acyltransferase n=1 Tax=Gordonia caeni TaxID=1007097 RepID=A0ABP7PJL4_9ACTN